MALKKATPIVPKRFRRFNLVAKTKAGFKRIVKENAKLGSIIKKIVTKKNLKIAAGGTAVGVGIHYLWDYIQNHSGCFLKRGGKPVCKVRELSCCQKGETQGLPFCGEAQPLVAACDGYNVENEELCCRLCSCDHYNCGADESMQCQRPTVSEAVAHFAKSVSSSIWDGLEEIFPAITYVSYLLYGLLAIFVIWLVNMIRRKFNKSKDA